MFCQIHMLGQRQIDSASNNRDDFISSKEEKKLIQADYLTVQATN